MSKCGLLLFSHLTCDGSDIGGRGVTGLPR